MPPARLLIGPLLRRVIGTRATVWVETAAPALVEVRTADGARGRAATFTAYGHHYALVVVEGLTPDSASTYQVLLDGEPVWPLPDSRFPPSVIRTRAEHDLDQPVTLLFGSCREATQQATPRRLPPDALDAYARRLTGGTPDDLPDLLVLLGDQVYADVTSRTVRRLLRRRRHRPAGAPAAQVVSFDEYTKLYLESWRDPEIRWLLSTVPSVMIFDDHEIIDDWNTSASWRRDIRRQPWWAERITSGLASYWVYQHLGNLDPDEIAADPVYAKVMASPEDATEVLREFGQRVDRESDPPHDTELSRSSARDCGARSTHSSPSPEPSWSSARDCGARFGYSSPSPEHAPSYQWSYALDIGRTRLVMLDNRCSRVLDPAHRAMLPPGEWSWFLDRAHGRYDHLVVGASLPWLLPPGIHHVEAWNEWLAESPHRRVTALAEKLRRVLDLEHWAAFRRSFDALGTLFARIGSGSPGGAGSRVGAGPAYAPPASISVLSGDVHHSYVARARFTDPAVVTPVHQLTCSPIHNQVPAGLRPLMRLGWSPGPVGAARALARSAGVPGPALRWRKLAGPYFGNAIATLRHTGRTAEVTIEGTDRDGRLRLMARRLLSRA